MEVRCQAIPASWHKQAPKDSEALMGRAVLASGSAGPLGVCPGWGREPGWGRALSISANREFRKLGWGEELGCKWRLSWVGCH